MTQRVRMQGPAVREREPVAGRGARHAESGDGLERSRTARSWRRARVLAALPEVVRHGVACRIAERQAADLRAFAEHRDRAVAEVDVADVETAALADAEAGAVEQLEHREVPAGRATAAASLRPPPWPPQRAARAVVLEQRLRVGGAGHAATSCGPWVCAARPRRRAPAHRGGAGSGRRRARPRPSRDRGPSRTRASGGTRGSGAACDGRGPTGSGTRRDRTTSRTRRRRARTRASCVHCARPVSRRTRR